MAGPSLLVVFNAMSRRDEDAVLAQAEAILLRRLPRRGRLRNPREAERFLRMRLSGLRQEELHAVWLDARHGVIACEVLARGTVDRAAAWSEPPREAIVRSARGRRLRRGSAPP